MQIRWGIAIIVLALIWSIVIFATSMVMEGMPQPSRVLLILGGGAAATIILLGGIAIGEGKSDR